MEDNTLTLSDFGAQVGFLLEDLLSGFTSLVAMQLIFLVFAKAGAGLQYLYTTPVLTEIG